MTNQESESTDEFSPGELRQEMARQSIAKYAKSATTTADVASTIIALSAVVMIVWGIALALSTATSLDGGQTHPHVIAGVALIVGAVVQACFGLMLSRGVGTVTRYVYYRTEFDFFE